MKSFTRDEVARHSAPGDMWVIIDGDVYDLSKFGKMHPGGEAVLFEWGGKDATDMFFDQHRLEVLRRYQRLRIGRLADAKGLSIVDKTKPDDISEVPYGEVIGLRSDFHSPYYTESHRRFRQACRTWVEGIRGQAEQFDKAGKEPTRDMWKSMGLSGMLISRIGPGPWMKDLKKHGVSLPGNLPGEEFDQFHELIAHTEFARLGVPGFCDGLGAGHLIAFPPILLFGTPAMKEKYVGPCMRGEIVTALAITEPFVGSDVANLRCTAEKTPCGKYYIINGAKKWITNGTFADVFIVAVRTGAKGGKGISMILVERTEGVTTKFIGTSYSQCAGTAYIEFKNVKVPVENLMGKEGEGFRLVMHNFNHERWVIVANCLGQVRAIVEDCFKWARQRRVFGKPLIEQPVIRFKLASMVSQLEAVWAWLETITHEMNTMPFADRQAKLGGPTALLKYQSTRVTHHITDEAVQIFGGRGITRSGMGARLENFTRFQKYGAVYGGSEEICADLGIRQALRSFPKDAKL
eukprot:TRINITY_DN331_c0_g1_i7.p1 TRINITY_DN331_c0_g1~~TRINITY_DN331_c0_g1_i7.p1  ORF type:complete len:520 (+),score=234.70 TRINITY_DN331_c0_g1_i7:43-1602(+)